MQMLCCKSKTKKKIGENFFPIIRPKTPLPAKTTDTLPRSFHRGVALAANGRSGLIPNLADP